MAVSSRSPDSSRNTPAERQAVDIDPADPGRVGLQVSQLGQGGVRAGHLGGADGDQRARLAGGGRVQEAGADACCPKAITFSPLPSSVYVPARRLAIARPAAGCPGLRRACASASPNRRSARASWPEENAIVPSTQLRSGDGDDASTASCRVAPRDSSASIRCSAAVSSRRSRSARSGEMSEAHCRWVAAGAERPPAASSPASRSS